MKDLLKELDLTSIKLDFKNQALKVAEELWEVLQAKKCKLRFKRRSCRFDTSKHSSCKNSWLRFRRNS